jgi:hypothetical protein
LDKLFDLKVGSGAGATPSWSSMSRVPTVSVLHGAGVDASDRLVVRLSSDAIRNQWIRVTVPANEVTGLTTPDVFYFGSLVGYTGARTTSSRFSVSALDLAAVKRALDTAAMIDNPLDVNRDARVNALDLGLVKQNLNRGLAILRATTAATAPPVPAAAPPASRDRYNSATAWLF